MFLLFYVCIRLTYFYLPTYACHEQFLFIKICSKRTLQRRNPYKRSLFFLSIGATVNIELSIRLRPCTHIPKINIMKLLWSAVAIIFMMTGLPQTAEASINYEETASSKYDAIAVKRRLERMESIVDVKFTPEVEQYIRGYLTAGIRGSEIMLGYGKVYFPVIEYTLQMQDLPEDLKYVTVIESNLRPYAVSIAGAAGMWQIMPETAKLFGLQIDEYIDERRDPVKSSQVALNYLGYLHDEFGSWELALAAYNCGPSRLKKIIRRAGTRDFWELQPYLPQETANYIPKFIAASYMMKYHFYHGLVPKLKDPTMLNTSAVSVFERTTFNEIEQVTNTKYKLIRKLNSMYFTGVVPPSENGHYVILPKVASRKLSAHVNKRCNDNLPGVVRIFTYTVKKGDVLSNIAKQFNCTVHDILSWNRLPSDRIFIGQKITLKVVTNNA